MQGYVTYKCTICMQECSFVCGNALLSVGTLFCLWERSVVCGNALLSVGTLFCLW